MPERKRSASSGSGGSSSAEEETKPQQRQEVIPESVDYFLGKLLAALETKKVADLHKLYEDDYHKLCGEVYKTKKWPSMRIVSKDVSANPLFLIMYRDLYYRHLYDKCQKDVTFNDRKGSWDNYCRLLELIISDLQDGDELSLALPAQWIWDILDEFVYHYQVYCSWRSKSAKVGKDKEISEIKENPDVFETKQVLVLLHQLVQASKIEDYLVHKKEGGKGFSFENETTRLLGYFAIMQLLRVHSLLGDYHLALKTAEKIDLHAEVPLFYRIPACHVTLYYYMGFAYMMMRRYVDSVRTFSDILRFLSKTNSGVNLFSYQYGAITKKREQMFNLMLMSLALCPRPIDESLEKTIRDQYGEKQARLQRGEELAFEELFNYSCPKFISAAPPNFDALGDVGPQEAHLRQLAVFKKERLQQESLPRIGSYMKLYTAIKVSKLAQLCEVSHDDLRDQLMCVMHKASQKVRSNGPPLDGEAQLCSEVEFYLDGDMVHINAQRTERPHAEVFLEQIGKFQDLLKKMGTA